MKFFKCLVKTFLWLSALLAAACTVIAYWDVIEKAIYSVKERMGAGCCCKETATAEPESEFADWEE